MLRINNVVEECYDGRTRDIDPEAIDTAAIHRIDFSGDDGKDGKKELWKRVKAIPTHKLTGPLMAAKFRDTRRWERPGPDGRTRRNWRDRPGSYTGGETPYAFLCRTDGVFDQCLRVGDFGPHAQRWSKRAIGIAFAGDFTKHPPTHAQLEAASGLFPLLIAAGYKILAHSELKGGSSDPDKKCPGELFPLDMLRDRAAQDAMGLSHDEAMATLVGAGMEF